MPISVDIIKGVCIYLSVTCNECEIFHLQRMHFLNYTCHTLLHRIMIEEYGNINFYLLNMINGVNIHV